MRTLAFLAALCLAPSLHAGAALTELETRWLEAGAPVLAYAEQQALPLDVVVQPRARPGDAPLAMAFIGGRCKLVLSMRDNPGADSALPDVAPPLRTAVAEAMVAHELGHCWRYVQGAWHHLPAGFAETGEDADHDKEHVRLRKDMRESRREEGFADLVGLAWTQAHHAQHYPQVYAWLERVRSDQPVSGGPHDTRAWVRLAKDPKAFASAATPFEQAVPLWREGLLSDE